MRVVASCYVSMVKNATSTAAAAVRSNCDFELAQQRRLPASHPSKEYHDSLFGAQCGALLRHQLRSFDIGCVYGQLVEHDLPASAHGTAASPILLLLLPLPVRLCAASVACRLRFCLLVRVCPDMTDCALAVTRARCLCARRLTAVVALSDDEDDAACCGLLAPPQPCSSGHRLVLLLAALTSGRSAVLVLVRAGSGQAAGVQPAPARAHTAMILVLSVRRRGRRVGSAAADPRRREGSERVGRSQHR